jgi:hypothetical protein
MSKAAIVTILFLCVYLALLLKANMDCKDKGGILIMSMNVFSCIDAKVMK